MELSAYNGWENKFTWLMHLHLSNEQELMQEVTEVVAAPSNNRVASRLLETWVKVIVFNWLSARPERDAYFDANVRLLAWDLTGSALAYADWDTLVSLFLGRVKKSDNRFTMTLYQCIRSDGKLFAFVQYMVQFYPNTSQCAALMQNWFQEQADMFFDGSDAEEPHQAMAALVNELLQQTYRVIAWPHVPRAFRPGY